MAREDLHGFVQNLCRRLGAHSCTGTSDAELLARWVAARDEAAFELLLRRHAPLVLGVCRRLLHQAQDVEDAFQAAFLLLVRKASSIRRGQSVGSWLYKVAYRVALRARAGQEALSAHTQPDLAALQAPPDDELLWRDLRPVLDDEVQRLPERYRSAFVLCHLQGLTNQEAADALGCPLGTVLSRLSWARQRLRSRLARRGLAVSAAGLVTVLAENAAPAAVPPELIQLTVTASLRFSSAAVGSAAVTRPSLLAKGVSKTMFLSKLKLATAAVALLGLLTVGGFAAFGRSEAVFPPSSSAGDPPRAREKKPARPEEGIRSVSTRLNGQILFLGTEIDPAKQTKEQMQRWRNEGKLIKVSTAYLATAATKEDKARGVKVFHVKGDDARLWRRWTERDTPEPNRMRVVLEEKTFLRLQTGTRVRDGQLLGLIDPTLAIPEVQITIAKLDASEAELRASRKTKDEALQRYNRLIDLRTKGTITPEELSAGRLTYERYVEEEKVRMQNIIVAQNELKRAYILLRHCELRANASGVVKDILKHKGEAVKEGEVVLRIATKEE